MPFGSIFVTVSDVIGKMVIAIWICFIVSDVQWLFVGIDWQGGDTAGYCYCLSYLLAELFLFILRPYQLFFFFGNIFHKTNYNDQ